MKRMAIHYIHDCQSPAMDLVGHQVGQRDSTRNQHNHAIACLTSVSKKQTELRFCWIYGQVSPRTFQTLRTKGLGGEEDPAEIVVA